MSAQVGIPNYKDLVNIQKLTELKNAVNTICLNFSKFASAEAIANRESELFENYTNQYNNDMIYLRNICDKAQTLVNECNEALYLISTSAVLHHIYNYNTYSNENKEQE